MDMRVSTARVSDGGERSRWGCVKCVLFQFNGFQLTLPVHNTLPTMLNMIKFSLEPTVIKETFW